MFSSFALAVAEKIFRIPVLRPAPSKTQRSGFRRKAKKDPVQRSFPPCGRERDECLVVLPWLLRQRFSASPSIVLLRRKPSGADFGGRRRNSHHSAVFGGAGNGAVMGISSLGNGFETRCRISDYICASRMRWRQRVRFLKGTREHPNQMFSR